MDIFECIGCGNKSYCLNFLYDNCPKCGKLHWHRSRIILAAIWATIFLGGVGMGFVIFWSRHHG